MKRGSEPQVVLTLTLSDVSKPTLLAMATVLWDLELLFELGVILSRRDKAFRFNQYFFRRAPGRLPAEERPRVLHLSYASPIDLAILGTVTGVGAFLFLLARIIEKLALLPSSVELQRATAAKVRAEGLLAQAQTEEIRRRLEENPDATAALEVLLKRFESAEFQVQEIQIDELTDPGQ